MNIKNIYQLTANAFSKLLVPIKSKYQVTANAFSDLLLPLTSRISEHRLAIRSTLSSTISSKPLNFITIASILPFFLGFYDFINQNQQLKKILFQKNIPAFSIPTESINWDTVQYFNETKKNYLQELKKVDWSINSLFLTKTVNTEPFNQEYFIASFNNNNITDKNSQSSFLLESASLIDKNIVFENSEVIEKENMKENDKKNFKEKNVSFLSVNMQNFGLNKFYFDSINKQSVLSLLQSFYLNLDEVPLKLDNLNSYYSFITLENKSVLSFDEEKSIILPFQEIFWTDKINRVDFVSQSEKIKCSLFFFTK
jgi:hypothetical protein